MEAQAGKGARALWWSYRASAWLLAGLLYLYTLVNVVATGFWVHALAVGLPYRWGQGHLWEGVMWMAIRLPIALLLAFPLWHLVVAATLRRLPEPGKPNGPWSTLGAYLIFPLCAFQPLIYLNKVMQQVLPQARVGHRSMPADSMPVLVVWWVTTLAGLFLLSASWVFIQEGGWFPTYTIPAINLTIPMVAMWTLQVSAILSLTFLNRTHRHLVGGKTHLSTRTGWSHAFR